MVILGYAICGGGAKQFGRDINCSCWHVRLVVRLSGGEVVVPGGESG